MVDVQRVSLSNRNQVLLLSQLASRVVKEYYDPILGAEQNDYMIWRFQSVEAIDEQLAGGYDYYLVWEDRKTPIGFLAFYLRKEDLYLSKLYLQKESRGKGYAREMLDFIIRQAKEKKREKVTLNVNRFNPTIKIYEKMGFVQVREEKIDIGGGYYMDDYVYSLQLNPKEIF